MQKIRLAIIGQGRSGRDIHCAHLRSDKRFEIVAVVDELDFRRERAKEEFGCDVYASYDQLYGRKDIDAVVNATYSHLHAPVSIDLLRNGFNVVTEKPFAKSPEDVDKVAAAIRESGKKLAIFQQSRFSPFYNKVLEIIDSGKLGRIVQVNIQSNGYKRRWDWQCLQENIGGNLYNTGPHPLDQALYLMGHEDIMPEVYCRMDLANVWGDAEDFVKLFLRIPGAPFVDLEISSCDAYPNFSYKVHGTRGGLIATDKEVNWRYYRKEDAPEQHLIRESLRGEDGTPRYCTEKLTWLEEKWNIQESGAFTFNTKRFYDCFYNYLVNDKPMPITLKQVRRQIAVIEECHRQNPLPKYQG